MLKKNAGVNSWQHAMLASGVSVCLVGAFLMGWGEPILGENHAGIAAVIGIVGIGIITKARRGEEKARDELDED